MLFRQIINSGILQPGTSLNLQIGQCGAFFNRDEMQHVWLAISNKQNGSPTVTIDPSLGVMIETEGSSYNARDLINLDPSRPVSIRTCQEIPLDKLTTDHFGRINNDAEGPSYPLGLTRGVSCESKIHC